MTTKHIDDKTWRLIEKLTVREVIRTEKSIKETEMLRKLILIGIDEYKK